MALQLVSGSAACCHLVSEHTTECVVQVLDYREGSLASGVEHSLARVLGQKEAYPCTVHLLALSPVFGLTHSSGFSSRLNTNRSVIVMSFLETGMVTTWASSAG
jgi:hypothetical protein